MSENTTTALETTKANAVQEFAAFGNESNFATVQRMAKCLCSSSIVPTAFQGEQNIGNCVIALEMSHRMGASPLAIMQSIYIVHGKPGWASTFLIACLNNSQRFTPLRFTMTGEKGKDSFGCIARATDKSSGEDLEGPEVTIAMAKSEGWYGKNGSKWPNMPELMLRYRAATFFVRLYSPETTMGIQTSDELIDVVDVDATVTSPEPAKPSFKKTKPKEIEAEPVNPVTAPAAPAPVASVTPPTPAAKRAMHPPAHDTTKPKAPAPAPQQPESAPQQPEAEPEQPTQPTTPTGHLGNESPAITDLRAAMKEGEVSEEQLLAFALKKNALKDTADKDMLMIDDILGSKISVLARMIRKRETAWKEIKGVA